MRKTASFATRILTVAVGGLMGASLLAGTATAEEALPADARITYAASADNAQGAALTATRATAIPPTWYNVSNASSPRTLTARNTDRGRIEVRQGMVSGQRVIWARVTDYSNANQYIRLEVRNSSRTTQWQSRNGHVNFTRGKERRSGLQYRACVVNDPSGGCHDSYRTNWFRG
ncbi:hypothetical protein HNR23_000578 [Nocardiopsis mwathae]|uniref:Uncharacterized protein n=1 Tax=Nocardiopsis mwathae TaxID=1472723 RepID=A0A7W9YE75_9ACTN|nr:hypothetical protein [Nocardiopsis mwathae]MBB6170518.1 hypothetical protein [Nocardiopsis mwathae]